MIVHLVEPGGAGGVYQHTMALASALAGDGLDVEVHTAADREPLSLPRPVPVRACLWRFGWLRWRLPRRAAVLAGWLAGGVAPCLARCRPGDVVHVQGWLGGLVVPLLVLRRQDVRLAFSPHNTFVRSGRGWEERLLAETARRADVVLTFSEPDRRRAEEWGARAVVVPFPVLAPPPAPEAVSRWRARWREPAVLVAGQLRPDKGLDLAVRAARWGPGVRLAIVGEDLGAVAPARVLAAELGVDVAWDVGFLALEDFVAAVAAADVVLCPYRAASSSAVLSLARALGRPSVGTAVGGLPELASVVAPPDDPVLLAEAVDEARAVTVEPAPLDPAEVAAAYARAYATA